MNFIKPFPSSHKHDYMWVIIYQLMFMVHLTSVNMKIKVSELTWKFRKEIMRLHDLPDLTVSDRDLKFTSRF